MSASDGDVPALQVHLVAVHRAQEATIVDGGVAAIGGLGSLGVEVGQQAVDNGA